MGRRDNGLLRVVLAPHCWFHAGATIDELGQVFGLLDGAPQHDDSLRNKMTALEAWETEQYASALSFGPS